tara:strand:+ start:425 stop:904 length:480 start_codon:yes stop_codon:yes gene_type:complete
MHQWGPPETGFTLKHFGPGEFKYSTLMDENFLKDLDDLREGCGFPLTITDSARTQQDLERIYAREIARGESYPTDSAHLFKPGEPVRAVDIKPAIPKARDGSGLTLEKREMELTYQILLMYKQGIWKYCGLGLETAHWHIDDCKRLGSKRPAFWIAVSK